MGFNSGFKGLISTRFTKSDVPQFEEGVALGTILYTQSSDGILAYE